MGFGKAADGETDTFSPDDSNVVMHVEFFTSLTELIERIAMKWPGVNTDDVRIIPVRIQTTYPGYHRGIAPEYSNFLKIQKL
jgi:hypothetical protein